MKNIGWKIIFLALLALTTLAVMPMGHQALACGGGGGYMGGMSGSEHHGSGFGYGAAPYGANPSGNPANPGHHGNPGAMHGQPNPGTWGPGATPPAGQVPPGQPRDHQGHHN